MPVSKDTGIFCFSDGLLKNLDRHSDLKTTVAVIHQVLPEHRTVSLRAGFLQRRQRFAVSTALTGLRVDGGEDAA